MSIACQFLRLESKACLFHNKRVSYYLGFKIAEEDLKLRWPGEFFGTRLYDLPEFRIGEIINDYAIIKLAREDAFELVKDGHKSKDSKKQILLNRIMERFKGKLDLINTG